MAQTATATGARDWSGGKRPFKASYGKLMMWFFLMSDAFTFSTLLVVYGVIRFSSAQPWADPEKVFTHFPLVTEWFGAHPPLAFVGLMTFVLIASSVTMVLAVEAGHRRDKAAVEKYMILTIIGGAMFLGCQAYEWYNFIIGSHAGNMVGALHLLDGSVAQFTGHHGEYALTVMNGMASDLHISLPELMNAGSWAKLPADWQALLPKEIFVDGHLNTDLIIQGANLKVNQYAQNPSFANLFFFITGFHGSHVASGVFLNWLIYRQVKDGEMERRGHYEMVEKVGLYWHFVDLVWVFVFTFFYLV
jgi:cytochrome c oxidase subunit 3